MTRRGSRLVAALFLLGPLVYGPEAHAGAWTQGAGNLWLKVTYMGQSAREEYVATGVSGREPDLSRVYDAGDRAPYNQNGRYNSRALFVDAWYGLTDRVDIGVQIPWFRQEFVNDALRIGFGGPRVASGLSDMRGFLKLNLYRQPVVASLKVGVKAPTGEFVNEEGIIPVGEAQWDVDVVAQVGKSFWPVPVYTNLDLGYRVRFRNAGLDRDPGNEWLYTAEVGAALAPSWMMTLKLEGIRGEAGTILGVPNESLIKRITYLSPGVTVGPWAGLSVEATIRTSLSGRGYPAGHVLSIGIQYEGSFRRN